MVTFRTNGPWGAGKGSNLTPAEVDANFAELAAAIQDALDGIGSPTSIADISYTNGTISFTLTDSSVWGPFDLPVAVFNWRGRFQGGSHYREMDTFFHPALGGFLVLQEHTAPAALNPTLQIGGAPVYQLMFRLIPGGHWPTRNEAASPYTLALSDASTYIRLTAGGLATVLVPHNDIVAFPIGTEINLRGAGSRVGFDADAGVTLNFPADQTETLFNNDVAFLKKVNTNEWDVWFSHTTYTIVNPTDVTDPTGGSASDPGTDTGNFFVEANSEGRYGRDGGQGFGTLINPIDGFNVYTLTEDEDVPDYVFMEVDGDQTHLASLVVTIEGLGTQTLDQGSFNGITDRTTFSSFTGSFGFTVGNWYTVSIEPVTETGTGT